MGEMTPQWNPLPAIGRFAARFAAGKVVGVPATVFLLPVVIAAARAAHGWVHLALGLGVLGLFTACCQTAGALFAADRAAAAPLAVTVKLWFVVPLLALWPLLGLAGIAEHDRQPMLTGVAIGVVAVLAAWLAWALIARRWPEMHYHPGHLLGRSWYVRLTMNAGGLLGGLTAIGLINS